MALFNTPPTINFSCSIPGVSKTMPIIPYKEYQHSWMKDAAKDMYVPKCPITKISNITRCPGLHRIQSYGWVIRTWQDITITVGEDGSSCSWVSPESSVSTTHPPMDYHDQDVYYKYRKNWPKESIGHILKVNTGWSTTIPKGFALMQLPVPLLDQNMFTSVEGMYYREDGPAMLNVPMYWHSKKGSEIIKAGTPIAYLVLVPAEQPKFSIEEDHSNTLEVASRLKERSFITNYSYVKKFWSNLK